MTAYSNLSKEQLIAEIKRLKFLTPSPKTVPLPIGIMVV